MKEIEVRFVISNDKLSELIELTEEPTISTIIVKSLTLYYEILRFQAKGYKIGMIPTHVDSDALDLSKNVVFINTDGL